MEFFYLWELRFLEINSILHQWMQIAKTKYLVLMQHWNQIPYPEK